VFIIRSSVKKDNTWAPYYWQRPRPRALRFIRCVSKTAKIDFCLRHVCLSVRMEQFSSHWPDFHEVRCLSIFQNVSK